MKNILLKLALLFTLVLGHLGCNSENDKNSQSKQDAEQLRQSAELPGEYLGIYHGVQESYFMKNQYGDDMIIAGNKVTVPSSDFKFIIKEKNIVNLQQSNVNSAERYYYEGLYKIISNEGAVVRIEVVLKGDQGSSPTYLLAISKTDKKGICTSENEPEFKIKKLS